MPDEVYLFPTSFAQRRLWFLDQLVPGNPFYNVGTGLPLDFQVDARVLERCLNEIIRRHEILRTTFQPIDGEPFQAVAPVGRLGLEVDDLRALPSAERPAAVQQVAQREVTRPFDLGRGPLMRARLLQSGSAEFLLLLTMHHIICDGWSLGVFLRELRALYPAFAAGRPSPLAELPIQYADFAVWQREWLQGDRLARDLAYWKERLAGASLLQLHPDHPRPVAQSFRGGHERFTLSMSLTEEVKALSRREDSTLFMTLLAAFTCLLHRYTGQEDVVVGVPVAGRHRVELEALIGFFINSIVLRADLSGNPSFREVLQRVRRTTLEAFAHQNVPFEKLVEELPLERDLSRNPLFQITFQLINTPELDGAARDASRIRRREPRGAMPEVQRGTAIFDLAFDLLEVPEGLFGQFEYCTDLFERSTIQRMARNFQCLLEDVTRHPDRPLRDMTCLSEEERTSVLFDWNRTEVACPDERLVHERFAAQAERSPSAVAVICDDNTVTYAELNERANRLAHYLIGRGVGPEKLVGIALERSMDLVVALLAVLKAGGAYVPVDPGQPQLRLAAVTSGLTALLVSSSRRAPFDGYQYQVICPDTEQTAIRDCASTQPEPRAQPDYLAYVLHTSGSTGRPKGVMIPHAALRNHMLWMERVYPLGTADRVLQRTPITFDASVWEFWAPWLAGGALVLAPAGQHGDPFALIEVIRRRQVTVMQMVPSLLQVLLDTSDVEQCTSLRRVFCGGEALNARLAARFRRTLRAQLVNLYGPTETTIDATAWSCPAEGEITAVPIGGPIDNLRAYVLDPHLNPVPIGVPGELHFGGVGLARGYFNEPALTAERFIPDPFSGQAGARLYRTGDLVRRGADGVCEFLGRIDQQVKLRGFRIELGEIEASLREHPQVKQAGAVLREDHSGELRLVAYVVARECVLPARDELQRFLRGRLPDYMIPAQVLGVDALPYLPSGKLDRRRLPEPVRTVADSSPEPPAPRTPLEELLTSVWADVLHTPEVGIQDNFFNDLGGHSLLATQLISRVRDLFGVEVPLQLIFEAPTVAGFAEGLLAEPLRRGKIEQVAELYGSLDHGPRSGSPQRVTLAQPVRRDA